MPINIDIVARSNVEQVSKDTLAITRSIATNLRKVAGMSMIVASAAGRAVDQILQMQIETVLISIESVVATQAALAAGSFGLAAVRGVFGTTSVVFLIATINKLRRQQIDSARSFQQISTASRMFAYV